MVLLPGAIPATPHAAAAYLAQQVQLHRDLLMVAGIGVGRRKKLIEAGITTIDQLAGDPGYE